MGNETQENTVWGHKIVQKAQDAKKGFFSRLSEEGQEGGLSKKGPGTIKRPSALRELRFIHPETGFDKCSLNLGVTTIPPHGDGPWHRHNCYEVFYILSGKGKFVIEGKEFWAEKGDAVNIPPNSVHKSINSDDEPFVYVYVVSPPVVANLDDIGEARKYGYITVYEEE